ncbi:hypothetical protein Ccrd_010630 [Cynara cardunculus var. scolymus]|uniref:Cyclin N-terminal domain-containing protein n=1 Tax=Cynara cardunculus var. scolymus TaxID=59895 RepID=A0A103YKT4_CYNCS|nr:hypothetical protein Ccrd_010630 [Cynara cardunculus var. scolymus]
MILNLLRYPPIPIQFSDKVPKHPSWSRCFYVWIIQPALAVVGAPENPVEVITGWFQSVRLSSLPNMFPTASLNFDVGALMILKPQDYLLQQNSVGFVSSPPLHRAALLSSSLLSTAASIDWSSHEKKMITNIDSDQKDPQMCSLYLMRRPRYNFIETVHRDVTQSMRGVLVDWLVEVNP